MPRVTLAQVAALPQQADSWFYFARTLRTWIAAPGQPARRPYGAVLYDIDHDLILGLETLLEPPTRDKARAHLLRAMAAPHASVRLPPHRPRRVILADAALARELAHALERVGVPCVAGAPPAALHALLRTFDEHLQAERQQVPGLLDAPGVTPALVHAVFAAAADFYRAEPWLRIEGEQPLAVRVPPETDFRYAQVMGSAGIEYGLSMFKRLDDLRVFEMPPDRGLPSIPHEGVHSLLFDEAFMIPFPDLDGLEDHHWPIAGETAIPLIMHYRGPGDVLRPSRQDLLWYEAALRAVPLFVQEHLLPDGQGDFQAVEVRLPVERHGGKAEVHIRYPAREAVPAEEPIQTQWPSPAGQSPEHFPAFDRRAMEGTLDEFQTRLGGSRRKRTAKVHQAQQLMYQAWQEDNPAQRLILAHRALALSPDCADACVLLAQEEADTVGRALALFEQGVAAGERALGKRFIAQHTGHLWQMLEARPYLRAMEGLAGMLWRMGRREESIARYRQMLRLNPGDNQGMRYVLLGLLLELERDPQAEALLAANKEDTSAAFEYTRALLLFRRSPKSAAASRRLRAALAGNPHVPAYLTLAKRVPSELPDTIGWGDESEAVAYASQFLNFWRRTPGAIAWLTGTPQAEAGATAQESRTRPRARHRHGKASA